MTVSQLTFLNGRAARPAGGLCYRARGSGGEGGSFMRILVVAFLLVAACAGHRKSAPASAAQAAAAIPDPTPPRLRLPGNVVPRRQSISLNLDPTRAEFSGTVDIDIDVREKTDVVWLHALDLTVSEALLRRGDQVMR